MKKPVIAITCGDPNGIGPEIALKAGRHPLVRRLCTPVLFGSPATFAAAAEASSLSLKEVILFDTGAAGGFPKYGQLSAEGGREAMAALDSALAAVKRKQVAAIVTTPLSKEAVVMSGQKGFCGHTEYLAAFAKRKRFSLALFAEEKCIAFVSTHVSLQDGIRLVRKARILETTALLHDFFLQLGCRRPRLCVSGLNPHASEHGLFGHEEKRHILPAVQALRQKGWCVEGPLPPDVAFPALFSNRFDGAVSMVHDHGHVAFKTAHLKLGEKKADTAGVNVTLGLPFIRTSVDHGTAFDIAGQNKGDPGSLIDAIRLAVRLSRKK